MTILIPAEHSLNGCAERIYPCGCTYDAVTLWTLCVNCTTSKGNRVEATANVRLQRILATDHASLMRTAEQVAMERLLTESPTNEPITPAVWSGYFR